MNNKTPVIRIFSITLLLLILLVACGIGNDAAVSNPITDQLREEVRPLLLADFDLLVAEVEANMPLSGVFYRRFGIELSSHFADMREHIVATNAFGQNAENIDQMERAAAEFLFAYLRSKIEKEFAGVGHFWPMPHDWYTGHLVEYMKIMAVEENAKYRHITENYEVFSNPAALWFYDVDMNELDLEDNLLGMYENDPNNIRTWVDPQGEVAWIRIKHAFNYLDFDRDKLFSFYEEIQEYPHLIIDIRGHRGGYTSHFHELIMRPLLTAPVHVQMHTFYMDGEHVQKSFEHIAEIQKSLLAEMISATLDYYDAAEYISSNNMTEFNPQDMEKLAYVDVSSAEIIPLENGFPFYGKIWVLTDHNTASAGEAAVLMTMSSGFATVVGTPTAGIMPSATSFVLLPNTGIIVRMDISYFTDALGRSLEEFGIIPDIPNRTGMDAEQTVLALIAEWNN